MRDRVHELGGAMSDEAVKSAAAFQDSLQDMTTAMSGMRNQLMSEFLPSFKIIMDGLTEIFSGNSGKGVELVNSGLQAMGDKISEMIPRIAETMGVLIQGLLGLIVQSLPKFLDMGYNLITKMINGISNNMPTIIQTILTLVTKLLSTMLSRLPEFLAMGIKLIAELAKGLLNSLPSVLSAIGTIVKDTVNAFKKYDWKSLGKNVISGIVSGLKNAGGAIKDMLVSLAKSAFNGVKKFFGIASPSKLMRDEIGKFIPQGIAVGIEANADSVYKAMDDLSNMTVDAYDPDLTAVAPATGTTDGRGSGAITINVYPSEGMDEKRLAERIEEIISDMQMRRRAVYA